MSEQIQLTIVIPVYNYAHTIERAMRSILKQEIESVEIILIDDGSQDDSAEVCKKFATQDPRVRFVSQKNAGAAAARNHGIRLARGEYLVFLDADDELQQGALRRVETVIKEHHPDVILGGHMARHDDGRLKSYVPGVLPDTAAKKIRAYLIDKKIRISNGAIFMHKKIFAQGLFPEQFRNGEDLPIFAQALCQDKVIFLSDPLVIVNKHADSLRHQTGFAIQAGMALVDEIFNERRLPKEAMIWRSRYRAQRALSMMRMLHKSGQYKEALSVYWQALHYYPFAIFNWSYTRKALSALIKQTLE